MGIYQAHGVFKALKRLCHVAYSFEQGNGGIAQAALLITRVLEEEAVNRGYELMRLAFADEPALQGAAFKSARGSKMRLFSLVHRAAGNATHFIYDSVNMAQAHPRLPILRRPNLTMLNGVEVWEEGKLRWIAAARRSTILTAISQHTKDKANTIHGGLEHAKVCWLASATGEAPAQTRPASECTPSVLIVSRIDKRENYKGHRELLEVWPQVVEAVPAAHLHIAGKGSGLEGMKTLAREMGITNSVTFHGFVPNEALAKMYNECRVYAMPSLGEGFGLVYLDAMRYRRPVIVSTADAGREIVQHGATGYHVPQDSTDQIAYRIITLLKNPELATKLGDAGQTLWLREFTYSAFKKRFVPILNDLLAK